MQLNLKFPPTPEFANQHSEIMVTAAKSIDDVVLDYSVASLEIVDNIIERMRIDGITLEQIAETLFGFGCYVGEVFVRNNSATWHLAENTKLKDVAGFSIVLELHTDCYVNPIGKVFKRFENGIEDNLPYFYSVFTQHNPSSAKEKPQTAPSGWFRKIFGLR